MATDATCWMLEREVGTRGCKSQYAAHVRRCLEANTLFDDPEFPPASSSLYLRRKTPSHPPVWLRPHEICPRPRFRREELLRCNAVQGDHGDRWLLACITILVDTPKLLERVVPSGQSFDQEYCGIFRFRFWRFGDWVEVLVDDLLPTRGGRLLYLQSEDNAEFWPALLEKAYAKFYGNYENLAPGSLTRALQDTTGGLVQSFHIHHHDKHLIHQIVRDASVKATILSCMIHTGKNRRPLKLRNGLLTQRAYILTALARTRGKLGEVLLVNLRDSSGKTDFGGPWSERSWEWDSLGDREKDALAGRSRREGVGGGSFWMAFEDFFSHFTEVVLVHLGPDEWMGESALRARKPWRAVLARRRWRRGLNAGGSPEQSATAACNPQFHLHVLRNERLRCHVVVALMQQYSPSGGRLHPIAFSVYQVPPGISRLTPQFLAEKKPLEVIRHAATRESVAFFTMPSGQYVVIPHTDSPGCAASFLFRVLVDDQANVWEANDDNVVFRVLPDDHWRQSTPTPLSRALARCPGEVDVDALRKVLRSCRHACLLEPPSPELCQSLLMLQDSSVSGSIGRGEVALILKMLRLWKKYRTPSRKPRASSYDLRSMLWEAGVTVSNKVLECLFLRFVRKDRLTSEGYAMALSCLHMAHDRYHSMDSKLTNNPLSLEEVILMTIYS